MTLGIYHVLNSSSLSFDWSKEGKLYPLNSEQQKWLEKKETLIVGVPDDTAPLLTFDSTGTAQGLLKDYMDMIGEGYHIHNSIYSGDAGRYGQSFGKRKN